MQKPRGERNNFVRMGIMMDDELLKRLHQLSLERKLKGLKDTDISSLMREAVFHFLEINYK